MIFSVLVFPLISFLWCSLIGREKSGFANAVFASGCMLFSAFFAGVMLQNVLLGRVEPVYYGLTWLSIGDVLCRWSFVSTPFVSWTNVIITTVSAMVHVYSISYMKKDARHSIFMGYLSFFTFMMLVLVSSDNLLQMFLGWEGVGLASYLLIGFWYERKAPRNAAQKAFIMNRIGDFGFVIALVLIHWQFGTLSLYELTHIYQDPDFYKTIKLGSFVLDSTSVIVLGLILAASGKSAQMFLHTWLPDAMEGPTPVSSLLHSATMVTAGVFLLLRFDFLLKVVPWVQEVVPILGAVTAIYAGLVATTVNDIKRIIAYSTCSQLGLMVMLIGVGGEMAAYFHLFMHAYFKSLLFLVAGAVIHGLSGEQDIRNMGGLWRHMPLNLIFMFIGVWALIGLDPFSGSFSKKLMLKAVDRYDLAHGTDYTGVFIFASMLTALYATRLIIRVFFGPTIARDEVVERISGPSLSMILPMVVLASCSIMFGGLIYNEMVVDSMKIFPNASSSYDNVPEAYYWAKSLPMLTVGIVTILMNLGNTARDLVRLIFKPLRDFLIEDANLNNLYSRYIISPYKALGQFLYLAVDEGLIHRNIWENTNYVAHTVGQLMRKVHNGYLLRYIGYLLLMILAVSLLALMRALGYER